MPRWSAYRELARRVSAFSNEIDRPVAQVALNWLVAQREIGPVISGGIEPAQVEENAAAAEWTLSHADFERLDTMVRGAVADLDGNV